MLQISSTVGNQTIETRLRNAADTLEELGKQTLYDLLLEAAEKIKDRDAQLWAINDELVKAGLRPFEYESFAACVAALRSRG